MIIKAGRTDGAMDGILGWGPMDGGHGWSTDGVRLRTKPGVKASGEENEKNESCSAAKIIC